MLVCCDGEGSPIWRIHELTIELGEKLQPAYKHIMTSGSAFFRVLNVMVDFVKKYYCEIIALTASVAANTGNDAAMVTMAAAMGSYSETKRRLNQCLNEPFVTVNTVTGDTGIKRAQYEYDQLMRDKTAPAFRLSTLICNFQLKLKVLCFSGLQA